MLFIYYYFIVFGNLWTAFSVLLYNDKKDIQFNLKKRCLVCAIAKKYISDLINS